MADNLERTGESESGEGLVNVRPGVLWHNFACAFRRLYWICLVLALLLGVYGATRRREAYTPYYRCTALFAVSASYSKTTDIMNFSYYYDAAAAAQLAATSPYIVQSETMRSLIKHELGVPFLRGTISAQSVADGGMFQLSVISVTPKDAYDILCALIDVYPQAATAILGDTQIKVLEEPTMPLEPYNKQAPRISILKYAALGFLIGLAFIALLSLARKTVHAAEDLRRLVNLPCLAYIPEVRMKKRKKQRSNTITIQNRSSGTAFIESIRTLRLKLLKNDTEHKIQTILVTSTLPNEGKSTISTNLALSLAANGHRVILIDADLRNQSLKASLGITEPSEGLVELLTSNTTKFRLLNVPRSSLLLLSGDAAIDHPQKLLDSPKMAQIINALRAQLDYIILDTPPAGILSDAATLAKYADAAVYVVRQDLASTTQILDSIQSLVSVNLPIAGCVMNGTQASTTRYGYGRKSGGYGYSKYGYGYGYGYGKGYGYGYGYGKGYRESQRGFDDNDMDELSTLVNSSEKQAAPTDVTLPSTAKAHRRTNDAQQDGGAT